MEGHDCRTRTEKKKQRKKEGPYSSKHVRAMEARRAKGEGPSLSKLGIPYTTKE